MPAPGVHLLAERARRGVRGARLLGQLPAALDSQAVRGLERAQRLHRPVLDPGRPLRTHQLRRLEEQQDGRESGAQVTTNNIVNPINVFKVQGHVKKKKKRGKENAWHSIAQHSIACSIV